METARANLVRSASQFLALVLFLFGLLFQTATAQVIPFDYEDGLIWVKVTTKLSETPLNFLLDSGAGTSVLDLATARKIGVQLGKREQVQCVGTAAFAWRVDGFRGSVGSVAISQTPLALDLQATSDRCSRRIDGLIGHDFFRGRIVQIDFKSRCIRVLNEVNPRNYCAVLPMKLRNDSMCVPASMNGSSPKWIRLDTGCDTALHWVARAGKGNVRASLQLGGEEITNVLTALHRMEIFPSEAGLLGNGVLDKYRVTIDSIDRRLLLEKS